MTRIETVLAATDLSAPARHAVDRGVRLARQVGARSVLVHVVSQGALEALRRLLGQPAAPAEDRVMSELRDQLQRLAAELGQSHGIPVEAQLLAGPVVREITRQADSAGADLIVLGARGAGFMRHLLLGSTAERMLRVTQRPLLVVRQLPHDTYHRVLVPVDFSPWSLTAVQLARAAAPAGHLILMHAVSLPLEHLLHHAGVQDEAIDHYRVLAWQEAQDGLRQLASDAGLDAGTVSFLVLHGNPEERILEQELVEGCDLIAIGKHGRNMVEEFLLGSVTKHVIAQASCDVLVSHQTARAVEG